MKNMGAEDMKKLCDDVIAAFIGNDLAAAFIGNDLIAAFKGLFEVEIERSFVESGLDPVSFETFEKEWVMKRILLFNPAQRLEVYCTWNGILGHHNRLFEIATGKL